MAGGRQAVQHVQPPVLTVPHRVQGQRGTSEPRSNTTAVGCIGRRSHGVWPEAVTAERWLRASR